MKTSIYLHVSVADVLKRSKTTIKCMENMTSASTYKYKFKAGGSLVHYDPPTKINK
ncbi:hypothetical protein KFK09_026405 [Dendrobium nobile]|uniref:Uncharacterized protein n=1 Tax=Dendrobium nobile TaxID=94219 RepID=A0A8T3A7U1_DENNO|nr:hypothetical protein KFK09_026405 [Dendrobium nobile]